VNQIQATPAGRTLLDYLLWSKRISTNAFAEIIGVSTSQVSRFRNGLRPNDDEVRAKIAAELGVTEAELGWESAE
jgi:transcriptional regulator with XRE-family HTH domain